MSEIVILAMIFLTMLTTYSICKMLDKRGYYFSLVIMNIIGFILSFKIGKILDININLNIAPVIASMTILYSYMNKYSIKDIKKLIKVALYSNIIMSLLITVMNFFIPAITETISINMQATFEFNYKILITYPLIMFISSIIQAKFYQILNELKDNNYINIILTYIITGLLPTIIFSVISYIKILQARDSLLIGITGYIVGIPILIVNLLLVNLLCKKKVLK